MIPEAIRNNAIWAALTLIGFLFAFYVKATFVTHEALAEEHSKFSSQVAKDIGWVFRRALEADGLQDAIDDAEDRILELQLYIDAAPDSSLTPAREQQIRVLETRKVQLQRKLDAMSDE